MPKRLHICLVSFCDCNIKKFGGCVICHLEGVFKTFATVYYKPQIPTISIGKVNKKKFQGFLVTAQQVGHKNRNGKMTTVLCSQCFLRVY